MGGGYWSEGIERVKVNRMKNLGEHRENKNDNILKSEDVVITKREI